AIRGTLGGHRGPVLGVWHFQIGGRPIVATAELGPTVRLWDLLGSSRTHELTIRKKNAPGFYSLLACTAVGGRPVALVVSDWEPNAVEVWDIVGGKAVYSLRGHSGAVSTIACVEIDGHPHALVGDERGGVRVWNLSSLNVRLRLTGAIG